MPIKESAKKYMRVSAKNAIENKVVKVAFRKAVKETLLLVKENKLDQAKEAFKKAQKALDKATKKGVLKANTAARKKSRLVKKIKAIQA